MFFTSLGIKKLLKVSYAVQLGGCFKVWLLCTLATTYFWSDLLLSLFTHLKVNQNQMKAMSQILHKNQSQFKMKLNPFQHKTQILGNQLIMISKQLKETTHVFCKNQNPFKMKMNQLQLKIQIVAMSSKYTFISKLFINQNTCFHNSKYIT